MQEED